MAKQYCRNVTSPRDGKTVYIGSDWKTVTSKQFNTEYTLRAGYEITERTIDKYGQFNLVPDIEVEAWWTNLGDPDEEIISLYHAHGECEQFHSEVKTDMDLERLPSGKFATNALILELGMIAYNILRMIGPGLPGGMMGSLMADLESNLESINKYKAKRNLPFMTQDQLLIKLFNEVAYVWPRVGYPPLVTPFSQYVKNLAMMNVIAMEKGKERWGMIADDIWDMLLGKAGKLPGTLAPEIIEKAEREGRKFFTRNPQDNYPDALDKYRKMMKENKWDLGEDDEELFEYAMHPAQYEAYKSGKAKEDFLADVEKRKAELNKSPLDDAKPKTLTVQVDGQAYRVTVAYGDIDLPADATAKVEVPVGEGQDVPAPLEGKFFLTKNAQETPIKVGDKVKKGDLLCYIEAMKTYNAIRADFDGTVTAICATSGDSVAEDDVLMKIG